MNRIVYIEDMDKWRKEFSFSIDVKVRFSDTDMIGHMNNVSAFIYFEEARIEYMKTIELYDVNTDTNEVPIVADLQCDFQEQVYYGESIKLYIKADTVGRSSADLHYMAVKENGSICFVGRGTVVKLNMKTGKSIPFTEEEKDKMKRTSLA